MTHWPARLICDATLSRRSRAGAARKSGVCKVGFWRFWLAALGRAYHPAPGKASTWTTYLVPAVQLIFVILGIGAAVAGWLLALVPFGLLLLLLLVGLFRGAHAIYKEEYEARKKDEKRFENTSQELKRMMATLQGNLDAKADEEARKVRRAKTLSKLAELIRRGKHFQESSPSSATDDDNVELFYTVNLWDAEGMQLIDAELPHESDLYSSYQGTRDSKRSVTLAFLKWKVDVLGEIYDRLLKAV